MCKLSHDSFGTKCEAKAHATRTFVKSNRNRNAVVLKIDFRNAFNELDRNNLLKKLTRLGAGMTQNAYVNVFNKKLRKLKLLFKRLTDCSTTC